MRRTRLLWQIFPTYLTLSIVILVVTGIFAASIAESVLRDQIHSDIESLARAARILALQQDTDSPSPQLQAFASSLARETNSRISIIALDGRVLADSEGEPSQMENHADRSEIIEALNFGSGYTERFSRSAQKEMLYFALPIQTSGENRSVVRVALPLAPVLELVSSMRQRFLIIGVFAAALIALISFFVSKRITRPIEEIKDAAEQLARGDIRRRLTLPSSAELAELVSAFNRMAQRLTDQISKVSEQRNALNAVLSSMKEGVIAVDTESRIVSMNDAAQRILNLKSESTIGLSVSETIRHSELNRFLSALLASSDTVRDAEIDLRDDNDRRLYVHASDLQNAEGQLIGMLIVMNDITKIRQLENVRRDFVANVSHELRTPITSIKGFVETLLDGAINKPEDAKRFLSIIARQCERLNAIIEDLLSLARIEEERRSIPRKQTQIAEIIRSAIDVCEHGANQKKIKLTTECPAEIQAEVNAPLLEQAIINLIDNAIKYSAIGSGVIVSATQSQSVTEISVTDNGPGIERSHLPRLFERFYRVDTGRSRAEGGTGLGLAIVKHIAQAHGGVAKVESTPGKGSIFSIQIPS